MTGVNGFYQTVVIAAVRARMLVYLPLFGHRTGQFYSGPGPASTWSIRGYVLL